MKRRHIRCLEEVLILLEGKSLLNPLLELKSSHFNYQKVFNEIENHLKEFYKNFTNLSRMPVSQIMTNLSHILGYGLGSTPESDDIFLGVIAAIYCLNSDRIKEFEFLSKFPFERFTTMKSSKMCREFLNHNFPAELSIFLELMKAPLNDNKSRDRFKQEVRKISKIGSSSGSYFLRGVLWKLKYFESNPE